MEKDRRHQRSAKKPAISDAESERRTYLYMIGQIDLQIARITSVAQSAAQRKEFSELEDCRARLRELNKQKADLQRKI